MWFKNPKAQAPLMTNMWETASFASHACRFCGHVSTAESLMGMDWTQTMAKLKNDQHESECEQADPFFKWRELFIQFDEEIAANERAKDRSSSA